MLTDTKIKRAKPAEKTYKLSDAHGLQLHVTPNGSKLWKLAYRFNKKQKKLSFGKYPVVSLSEAREKQLRARKILDQGNDPSAVLKEEKIRKQFAAANTFGIVADEYLKKRADEQAAEATLNKKRWLLNDLASDLHHRPIKDIKATEILSILRSVESKGNYETASRLRSAISQVFRYALATQRVTSDPCRDLKGALRTAKVNHLSAITNEKDFSQLVRDIWSYDGIPSAAGGLKLMALLYPRPGELRFSTWDEFDLENRIWTIPAERAKMRRDHQKPLSQSAISILEWLKTINGYQELVLASTSSADKPISENTFNKALRRLGYSKDQATAHGFRSSASTLLNESNKWSADAIERELGHVDKNSVRATYNRGAFWDERVEMSEWWANWINEMLKSPPTI